MKVEFYHSSKHAPGPQFPCDNKKAIELCQQLQAKGVTVKVQDCGDEQVAFMTYNAAVTGPPAAKRSVFGAKGGLQEDFGRTVPALLVFDKEGDRYPTDAYPRSDRDLDKLVGVEEALKNLLSKA